MTQQDPSTCEHLYLNGQCPFCVIWELRKERQRLEARIVQLEDDLDDSRDTVKAQFAEIQKLVRTIDSAGSQSVKLLQAQCTNLKKKLKKLQQLLEEPESSE